MTTNEVVQLLNSATRRAVLRSRLDEAKARFRENTVYAFNGGLFQISPAFLAEVQFLKDNIWRNGTPAILLDRDQMPVAIERPQEFLDEVTQRWNSAISRFHIDVTKARQTHIPDLLDQCGG